MVFAVYHLLMVHLLTSVAKGNGESLVVSFVVVGLFFLPLLIFIMLWKLLYFGFCFKKAGLVGSQTLTCDNMTA